MQSATRRSQCSFVGVGALVAALAAFAACGSTPARTEATTTSPTIKRISALRYVNKTVSAVVRFDAPIAANGPAFFADPSLRVGETPGANQGVSPAEAVGDKERHCYHVEARRLRPVAVPGRGSRTKLGFAAKATGKSGTLAQVIPAQFARKYVDQWQYEAARQLGCGS